MCPNIKRVTWNFTEAGYGKEPMDGVGGVLNRTADAEVAHGSDINSIEKLVSVLTRYCPSIIFIEVSKEKIDELKPTCNKNKQTIAQIMKMHQAVWEKSTPNLMYTRSLSCMECQKICSHHKLSNGFVDFESQFIPRKFNLFFVFKLDVLRLIFFIFNSNDYFQKLNLKLQLKKKYKGERTK